ncbi:hypothetical protein QAD02_003098 [Eretmocerus hayati]|uniref:Uncharacterized protein n=1 Tax=Eretmocerus hayati TaxID=131215 RepID=A0ACC2NNE9_9HYME|nr:hypothetical protein QAD02_003098 [Eretmocerus hayati]
MAGQKKKKVTESRKINCSVPGCGNKKQFYFPKSEILRAKWLKAIRREDFTPNVLAHGLCGDHFDPNDIITFATTSDKKIRQRVKIAHGSVPCIFPWNRAQHITSDVVDFYEEVLASSEESVNSSEYCSNATNSNDRPVASDDIARMSEDSLADIEKNVPQEHCHDVYNLGPLDHVGYCLRLPQSDILQEAQTSVEVDQHSLVPSQPEMREATENGASQLCGELFYENEQMSCDYYEEVIQFEESVTDEVRGSHTSNEDCSEEISPSNKVPIADKYSNARYSIEQLRLRSDLILHFTGLENYKKFELVLLSLGPAAYHLKYVRKQVDDISVPNQLFLVLWKLRRNECDESLAAHFGINRLAVGNIFVTWILFMHQHWSLINTWPSKDLVHFFLPEIFKNNFPDTRVIIDGAEFEIQKPGDPRDQQSSFSKYKNRNTYKAVLGCTPGGLISYCSPAYGGSTKDRAIVERSVLMKNCERGDIVMADKGFNIQDLFAAYDVTCMIPTFMKHGYIPHKKILRDRNLAKHRIHIERVIGLVKTFTILSSRLHHNYVPLASEILQVCVMLSNFKENIMKPKKEIETHNLRMGKIPQ